MDPITDSQQRAANYNSQVRDTSKLERPSEDVNRLWKVIDELTKENKKLKEQLKEKNAPN